MARRLSAEERALWRKVVERVRPLHAVLEADQAEQAEAPSAPPAPRVAQPAGPAPAPARKAAPGTTLDGTWDRRLSRGLVRPDLSVDLHGHNLGGAHALLDERLERAIASGARLLLVVTGKAPTDERRPVARGAIRAAIGDWLAASRHAADIAAIRNAHPRHGGAGALYIVLRRARTR